MAVLALALAGVAGLDLVRVVDLALDADDGAAVAFGEEASRGAGFGGKPSD